MVPRNIIKSTLFATIAVFFSLCFLNTCFADEDLVLYVREGCSHCKKVENFMKEHSLEDKIEVRDLSFDLGASEAYTDFMERNEVPLDQRGAVPILTYGESGWVSGDTPIIEYLAKKYDIEIEKRSPQKTNDMLYVGGGTVFALVVGYGIVNMVNERKTR